MKFGLTKEEFQFIYESVVQPLEKLGAKVFCYGSRARGDYNKFSDLDIMVEGGSNLDGILSSIREKLVNSNFPYKVDLVEYKHFADSYKKGYNNDKVPFQI
tara:strand:+ start:427 stop:729 length:303 start_codon:yes stop_codon:yes gene_type:complete